MSSGWTEGLQCCCCMAKNKLTTYEALLGVIVNEHMFIKACDQSELKIHFGLLGIIVAFFVVVFCVMLVKNKKTLKLMIDFKI